MKKKLDLDLVRILNFVLILAGAAGTLIFVLHAGHKNNSVLLILLFVTWTLSPFTGLFIADIASGKWSSITRITLYSLIPLLTVGSFILYSGVVTLAGTKPAFVFLVVPLVSWLLMAVAIPLAAFLARRRTRGTDLL